MGSTRRWAITLAMATAIAAGAATLGAAAEPPAASTSPALAAYLEGLDALRAGRAADAANAFSRALETRGDDASFVLARAVARTLALQFGEALADLERATKLGVRGREPELWTYVAEAMSGQVGPDHALGGGPRSLRSDRPGLVSIPGHLAQGRDDYPTDYASFVIYDLAMRFQTARLPPDMGGAGDPAPAQRPEIREAMRRAGAWFANLKSSRADLAPAHLARGRALHDQQRYGEALDELAHARDAYPGDPEVRYWIGDSWLALGRPATARRELTIALTRRTDFAAAYLSRALAAARTGDDKRAEADLAMAARLDDDAADTAKPAIRAELARHRSDGDPAALTAQLEALARASGPGNELAEVAARLVAADARRRLRYDESYQDGLRSREDAVRADPKSADKRVEVARFLVSESENRGEAVEPRRAVETYRWQLSRTDELEHAVRVLDDALAIKADHPRALIWKAMALDGLARGDEAESLAEKGVALAHDDPEALALAARFRARRANRASAEASSLRQERCSSSSHDETRSDGVYRVTQTTCYPPSAADTARADQLDALAQRLRQGARAALEKAVSVTKGTEQALLQVDLELWFGDASKALGILEQAVAADPRSLEAQEALADLYAKSGQRDRAEEQLSIARQLVHTTAAPLLRLGWQRIERTAWQGASDVLGRARLIDPTDPRVPLYQGVALEAQGKTSEAMAAYRRAAAVAAARIASDDLGGASQPRAARDPEELSPLLTARARLAARLAASGDSDAALTLHQANARDAGRIAREQLLDFTYGAMTPNPNAKVGDSPQQPLVAAALVADAHRGAARALDSLGRADEAAKEYEAVMALATLLGADDPSKPRIGTASEPPRNTREHGGDAVPEASRWLAKRALAAGDPERAARWLAAATGTNGGGRGRDTELEELSEAVRIAQQQRATAPPPSGPSGSGDGGATDAAAAAEEAAYEAAYRGADPRARGMRGLPPDVARAMEARNDRAAAIERQRQQQAMRMAGQQFAANARVDPALVGSWVATPQNRFLPGGFTFTLDAQAKFTLAPKTGPALQGQAQAMRGSLTMIDGKTGELRQAYYELGDPNTGVWTDLDATKYDIRRQR
ncbi:MAG: tetratricopeptide repeat protein [bacterium]